MIFLHDFFRFTQLYLQHGIGHGFAAKQQLQQKTISRGSSLFIIILKLSV